MSSLVEHANRELFLLGNDTDFNESILKAVKNFASYGHSGGSAAVGIEVLHQLLQFKNLTPLTDDPKEWNKVGVNLWQNSRNPEAFSRNRGFTYYLLSEGANEENPWPQHKAICKSDSEEADGVPMRSHIFHVEPAPIDVRINQSFRQIGWVGHSGSGTFYRLDETPNEPGGFSPVYIEVGD